MGAAQVVSGVGEAKWGDECSGNGEDGKRFRSKFSPTFSWKKLSKETLTTEAGSELQYFTTLTENADLFLRRWLAP